MIQKFGPKFIYPLAERYVKRDITSKRVILSHRLKLPGKMRQLMMKRQLSKIIAHARSTVPYYMSALKTFSIDKLQKDLSYLHDIPLLTKEIIQENGSRMISSVFKDTFLHERKTGGSTGPSAIIKYSQEDLDWTAAVNLALDNYTGRGIYDKEIHLSAEFNERLRPIDQVYGFVKKLAMNRVNVFVRELDDESLRRLTIRLAAEDAYIVQAHPSTIFALSNYVERKIRLRRPLFRFFESTGEAISTEQIAHIEKNLGCHVFNRYGSAEFGVVAHSKQDPERLEVIETVAYPEEVTHSDGMRELILTGFLNQAMPLIRYRSGDSARVECHDGIYSLTDLKGRVHDIVEVHGKMVATHYMQDVLDRVGAHREFQILHNGNKKQVTRILVAPNESGKPKELVESALEQFLGRKIEVVYVGFDDFVKVGWREKFRRAVKDPNVEN